MPQTTQCPNCGVVLNLPDGAAGRRLRCPKCSSRFEVPGSSTAIKPPSNPPPPSNANPNPNAGAGRPASSLLLTESTELQMPRADMDLREAFAPDLLLGEAAPGAKKPGSNNAGAGAAPPPANDAEALFKDDAIPARPRQRGGAEARAQARRCPNCQRVVPAGMSLCQCGLDLDTGRRDAPPEDDLYDDAAPAIRRSTGPPLDITILGGVILVAGLVLTIAGLGLSTRPQEDLTRYATLVLAAVGAFTVYAGVQFLRGKSHRAGIFALVLIALANVGGMIVWPIIEANRAPAVDVVETGPVGLTDESLPQFENTAAKLDARRLTWGVILLVVSSGLIVYTLRPKVARYFERRRDQGAVKLV